MLAFFFAGLRFGFGRLLALPLLLRLRRPMKNQAPIPAAITTIAIGIIGRLELLATTAGTLGADEGEVLPLGACAVPPLPVDVEVEVGSGIAFVSTN